MWPPLAGDPALPELSGIRHRAISRADRHQVRFDAVQSRHRSQATALEP
jgi:hypothetical protein